MTKVIARVHPVHMMAANPQTKPIDLGCESVESLHQDRSYDGHFFLVNLSLSVPTCFFLHLFRNTTFVC